MRAITQIIDLRFAQAGLVHRRIDAPGDTELQRSARVEGGGHGIEPFLAVGRQGRAARRKLDVGKIFTAAVAARDAADSSRQQPEGRRDRLGQDIHEGVKNDAAEAELRIVERARDRDVEVNLALRILQNRDGEPDRQILRSRAFDAVAESELIEKDMVGGGQLLIRQLVMHIDGQACPW